MIFVDYGIAKECKNPDAYGALCEKCEECGRKFNDYGIMIDDGGTHEAWEQEGE